MTIKNVPVGFFVNAYCRLIMKEGSRIVFKYVSRCVKVRMKSVVVAVDRRRSEGASRRRGRPGVAL